MCINFNIIAVKFGFVKGYTLFSGTNPLGHLNRADGSPYPGGSFFQHRLSGALEPRRRFTLSGREFFAEPQRGDSPSADGGSVAAPAAGTAPYPRRRAKRKGHLRFPFLFELLPFPCFLIWRRLPTCDRSEIGYGRGFFLPCLSQPVRSIRYRSATQTVKFPQARHSSAAQFVSAL